MMTRGTKRFFTTASRNPNIFKLSENFTSKFQFGFMVSVWSLSATTCFSSLFSSSPQIDVQEQVEMCQQPSPIDRFY